MVIILFIIALVIFLSVIKLKGRVGKQAQSIEHYYYKSKLYLLTKAKRVFIMF